MIRVHMIDDDEEMHELLMDYFADEPIAFSASPDPISGLEYIRNHPVDLVLLDLMLPGMDGFAVCQALRQINPLLPIIMLTARKDDYNKIIGLELGADDYLSKPFNPRELLARIKTIMRRFERGETYQQQSVNQEYLLRSPEHNLLMNLNSRQVFHHDRELGLTSTEFDLLKILMENAGIVQSRDVLMDKIRGLEFDAFDRTIDVLISRLRHKLHTPHVIKTVRNVGYLFTRS